MTWKEIKKLFKDYKNYCSIIGLNYLSVTFDGEFHFEQTFNTSSIVLQSGGKAELSDVEVFLTALLVGRIEMMVRMLHRRAPDKAIIIVGKLLNNEDGKDIAERLGYDTTGDKGNYWRKRVNYDLLKSACNDLVKIYDEFRKIE